MTRRTITRRRAPKASSGPRFAVVYEIRTNALKEVLDSMLEAAVSPTPGPTNLAQDDLES